MSSSTCDVTMRRMELISQHMEEANYVYSMRTRHVQLFDLYSEHLREIVEQHRIEDYELSHASFLADSEGRKFARRCFTQICLPFIRLLYLLSNKFKNFIFEDSFQETVNCVDKLSNQWINDSGESDSPLDSALCFKLIREEIMRLHKMIERGERSLQTGVTLMKKTKLKTDSNMETPAIWDVLEVSIPEETIRKDGNVGPRHDNDRRRIRSIKLLPTTQEWLFREPPLLSGNFPFHENAHWLPPGPERWDLEYRLREMNGDVLTGRQRDAGVDYNVYPIVNIFMLMRHTFSQDEREKDQRKERHGLCMEISFPHPSLDDMAGKHETAKMKDIASTRRELWEKTRRLPYGGMVALGFDANGNLEIVFCQIVQRDLDELVNNFARITVQPYETCDFETLERWRYNANQRHDEERTHSIMLIEFNKVFFIGYEPVLHALQRFHSAVMPFQEYLAPDFPPRLVQMETPLYCLAPGFKFDLTTVIENHSKSMGNVSRQLHLDPKNENSRVACETELARYSTLERDQAKPLVQVLSSRVACIQGLPGTGKSFIGALLTQIIVEAKVSPILIVCYANHSLNQFLCHLLDVGIKSVVRIGGQCKEPRDWKI